MLQEGGLVPAIRRLVSEIHISGGPDVEFGRLEPPLEYAAFRIIQECLRNAHRHSRSSKVEVRLSRHTSCLRIEVEDFGIGISPQYVAPGHFGLESVQKRASLLGGHAQIDSAAGRGTHITVELPLVENLPLKRAIDRSPVASDSRQLRTKSA